MEKSAELLKDDIHLEEITQFIYDTLMDIDGVKDFYGGITDTLTMNILGKKPISAGIKINKKDDTLKITLNIISKFGVNIPELAWNIQKILKSKIQTNLGLKTSEINVHVDGIME